MRIRFEKILSLPDSWSEVNGELHDHSFIIGKVDSGSIHPYRGLQCSRRDSIRVAV